MSPLCHQRKFRKVHWVWLFIDLCISEELDMNTAKTVDRFSRISFTTSINIILIFELSVDQQVVYLYLAVCCEVLSTTEHLQL